jgi:anti-sigma factor RsiW
MRHNLKQQPADHFEEETLLLLLGGELNVRAAKTIGTHLERCPQCRSTMRELQKGINAFVEYSQAVLSPSAGTPPQGWRQFPAMLDRVSRAAARKPKQGGAAGQG